MSSRRTHAGHASTAVASFQYRTLVSSNHAPVVTIRHDDSVESDARNREEMVRQRLLAEHAAGYAEAETRLRQEFELRSARETAKISEALLAFEQTRKQYFARVETEVVQLALAIAGKIIHREAQVDPMLIAAIVQIGLGQVKDGSSASVRVRPEEAQKWRAHFQALALPIVLTVAEDGDLERGDCILETELGSANFSLDAQLKEVEQGFFDLLAQKPQA